MATGTGSGNRSGSTKDRVVTSGGAGIPGSAPGNRGRRRSPISGTVYGGPSAPPPERPAAPERPPGPITRRHVSSRGRAAAPKVTSFDLDPELDGLTDDLRRRREYREAGDLSGELLEELTGLVHGVHSALAGRVFRYVGPPAAPLPVAHDTIAGGVYGALKAAGTGLAKATGRVLAR